MTPPVVEVTCLDTIGMVNNRKGRPARSSLFKGINANPGPCQGCLDLRPRRTEATMDATTARAVR